MEINTKKTFLVPVLLAAAFLFFPLLGVFSQTAINCGDANEDGVSNVVDALVVAQYSAGKALSPFNTWNADVNSDNAVNILDSVLIAQAAASLCPDCFLKCGEQKVWVSHDRGIQCEVPAYETLADAAGFLRSKGIQTYATETEYLIVITLCGVPSGIIYKVQIALSDLAKARELGWN